MIRPHTDSQTDIQTETTVVECTPVRHSGLEAGDRAKAAQQAQASRDEEGQGQLQAPPLGCPLVPCLMHSCINSIYC